MSGFGYHGPERRRDANDAATVVIDVLKAQGLYRNGSIAKRAFDSWLQTIVTILGVLGTLVWIWHGIDNRLSLVSARQDQQVVDQHRLENKVDALNEKVETQGEQINDLKFAVTTKR